MCSITWTLLFKSWQARANQHLTIAVNNSLHANKHDWNGTAWLLLPKQGIRGRRKKKNIKAWICQTTAVFVWHYMCRSAHKSFVGMDKILHLCAVCVLAKMRADESSGSEIVWRLVIKAPLGVWSVISDSETGSLCWPLCSALLHPPRPLLYSQIGSRLMNTNSELISLEINQLCQSLCTQPATFHSIFTLPPD